ncbi:MAG: 3-phosphoserine/phosphohydroxythreonine transaminase [Bacteroidales bacterium]|nr:3-phosphoserine/phosphohydroxythreonine transaminase [Bacteroidales bacterium]
MKKHNFYAGPAILSQFTIENTSKAILNFEGTGLSIMEISHRSKEFQSVMDETIASFKELLNIPSGYSVLLLGGGASLQFCMVPYNLLNKKAAYLNTGSWASKAMKEAKFFGEVIEVASSKEANYTYIPKDYKIPVDADYFHVTSNNTIYGTEIKEDLDVRVPLVCDASSDFMCRPVDISKYAIIYAGAQKNVGPSGLGVIIIKENILGKVNRQIPTLLNYQTHIENQSMYHTPPVVPIYATLQTLKWYKKLGGLESIYKINIEKAAILYEEIERNKLFKGTVTNEEDRSLMNVTFVMNDEYKDLEKSFLDFATSKGMIGLKGHRSVGGFRASIYNAMSIEGVRALIDVMQEFEKNN